MKKTIFVVALIFTFGSCGQPSASLSKISFSKKLDFALANPIIESESIFFTKKNNVHLYLGLKDVKIHFTLDGSDPTPNAPFFSKEIILEKSTTLKAKAFHPDFRPSETIQKQFIKLGEKLPIKNLSLNHSPNENYKGKGTQGLFDRKKGTTNFRTNEWLGFSQKKLEAIVEFENTTSIQKVIVSTLLDHGSWIFLPQTVTVYFSTDGKNYTSLQSTTLPSPQSEEKNNLHFIDLNFEKTAMKFLKIKIETLPSIPDWHAGKGTTPWLFLDEILME